MYGTYGTFSVGQLTTHPFTHRRAAETFPHPDRSHCSVRVGSLHMSKKSRFIRMFKNSFWGLVEIPDLVNMQLQNVPAVAFRCRTIYALIPWANGAKVSRFPAGISWWKTGAKKCESTGAKAAKATKTWKHLQSWKSIETHRNPSKPTIEDHWTIILPSVLPSTVLLCILGTSLERTKPTEAAHRRLSPRDVRLWSTQHQLVAPSQLYMFVIVCWYVNHSERVFK